MKIKESLITPPVFAFPDYTRPFLLSTDASQTTIGAVLEQVDRKGHVQPSAFFWEGAIGCNIPYLNWSCSPIVTKEKYIKDLTA